MFFRAEDAFGFSRRVEREMNAINEEADRLLADEKAGAAARRRAAGFVRAQRGALVARYGKDPHAFSHGETFLGILRQRLVPCGLYLLDEPETPLSPTRVLALLVLIHDAVHAGSQFIIATHSPILAAYQMPRYCSLTTVDYARLLMRSWSMCVSPEIFLQRRNGIYVASSWKTMNDL